MSHKINWQALEYEYKPKSADWFWTVWIVASGATIASFLLNNILFGIFILLSAFSVSIYASKKPSLINFSLSEKGISINNKLISYSALESFWITEDLNPTDRQDPDPADERSPKPAIGQGKILFKAKRKTSPYISIPLTKKVIDSEEIKEYLLKHLKEIEHNESLLQTIIEKLGF